LANFYLQSGDKGKAREVYQQILAINPADARAKIALAEENKGGDDARYLASLKPVFENPQTDIDLKIKQIIPYVTRLAETTDPSKIDKSISDALLELTSILEQLHPANAKAFSVSGDVLNYSGNRDKAIEKYKKTLDLDDTVWLVWEQLLYLYAEKRDYANLSVASEKALDIFPNQATAHYLNGVANNGKGKPKDALSALQQALIMSSKNQRLRYDVLIETGKAYFLSKQYAQSDNSFEEALKINPNGLTALYQYSHCLAARSEQLDKAKDLASRLNTIAPEHPSSADALAFVFYKTKDFKTAKDLLFKALQQGGDEDPIVLEHYGDVLFQTGNSTEAVQYWQKALEGGGRSEFLEKKAAEGKLFE
jgi:tetratricopeptide (TPR) repeat protein